MKKFFLPLVALLLFIMAGCNSSSSGDSDSGPAVLTRLELSAEKLTIEGNGIDSSVLSVAGYDQNDNAMTVEGVKYLIDGKEITSPFTTNKEGQYVVVANANNILSNEITITATAPEVTLAPNSTILGDDRLGGIVSYDKTAKTVVFTAAEGGGYGVGDVLVAGISEHFPHGLLGKVSAVDTNGDNIAITLEDAELTDVIENGSVSCHMDLKQSDLETVRSNYSGISLKKQRTRSYNAAETDLDFVLTVNSVIYDADGNGATTDDQVKVNGELTIDPGIDLTIDIDWFEIEEFTFGVETNITGNLVLSGDLDESWGKEIVLASYAFAPFTFQIGTVPIVLTPSMDLVVGANGEIEGKFRCAVSEQAVAGVKAGYTSENGWGGHNNFDNDFDYSEPELEANAQFKVYTGAVLKIALYQDMVAAGYGKVLLYFKGEADINADPWWCLKGGIESVLGFNGLGLDAFDYTVPLFERNIVCADAFGTGEFDPDNEVEKGWARQYTIPKTMTEDVMINHNALKGVVSNGNNGFVTVGSEPYFFSTLLEYNQAGVIEKDALLKVNDPGAPVFHAYGIVPAQDDYILAGIGGSGLVISRVDKSGHDLWTKTVPASVTLSTPDIAKLGENKFIAYIGSEYVIFNSDGVVQSSGKLKYDLYPQDTGEESMFVEIAGAASYGDGYFIVASFGLFYRGMIAKYDNNDNLLWSRHIGIPVPTDENVVLAKPTAVAATETGDFYIAGMGEANAFVAKFDANGKELWLRIIDNSEFIINNLAVGSDGGVFAVGTKGLRQNSDYLDIYNSYILKFSESGVFAFAKVVSDRDENIQLNALCERDDGKMMTAVGTRSLDGRNQPFIMTVNPLGEVQLVSGSAVTLSNLGKDVITNWHFTAGIGNCEINKTQSSEKSLDLITYDLTIDLHQTF